MITKKECEAYEKVRVSGITNMWDIQYVSDISGLDRDIILEIMRSYSELNELYHFRKE